MTRHLFCLFAALVVLTSCKEEEKPGYNPPEVAEQTMLLYMPGRSLLSYYKKNINGIEAAVSASVPGDGRILVCYQPDSYQKAELIEIYYSAKNRRSESVSLRSYESFAAEDPASVSQMLADVAELAPAHRYGLIIGCHGKAWIPSSGGTITNSLRKGHPEDDLWTPAPGALPTRSFGDAGREINIAQLATVIVSQRYKFDYLIFDACFMASIETLYELRNAVPRIIAAPCEIMAAGFPYNRAVPRLFSDRGKTCDLEKTCYEFWNFYMNDWNSVPLNAQSGCISMAVSSELQGLADIMRRIHAAGKQPYTRELQVYEGLKTHLFYDLGDYVSAICNDPALLSEFSAQLDKAFPAACRLSTPSFYSAYSPEGGYGGSTTPVKRYSGVSLSEPSTRYTAENRQTSWYLATHP